MAQGKVSIRIFSPPATSITFTPVAAEDLVAPVEAGSLLGKIVVSPPDWKGELIFEGDTDDIQVDTDFDVVAGRELLAGDYELNITSNP